MKKVLYLGIPFVKEDITLALEGGAEGVIVPQDHKEAAASLARWQVTGEEDVKFIRLNSSEDELRAAAFLDNGETVVLERGFEIIPVENLLAHAQGKNTGLLALEVSTSKEAMLAATILEKGAEAVVVSQNSAASVREIVNILKSGAQRLDLQEAEITSITSAGMGHRVCVDTMSILRPGQGLLVGNSAAFTFLVNAETEHNEYVASRPFRVNAGGVHAYVIMPEDRTSYLEELRAGSEVLAVDFKGSGELAVVGRVKVERRPMLLIEAKIKGEAGGMEEEKDVRGAVFLQNAETICLVRPDGSAISVTALAVGDKVLCRSDKAGRHFGMRIEEDIREV